jgi:hypothetical protein
MDVHVDQTRDYRQMLDLQHSFPDFGLELTYGFDDTGSDANVGDFVDLLRRIDYASAPQEQSMAHEQMP